MQEKWFRIAYRKTWSELPVLWRFSIPAFLSSIVTAITLWAADAILANLPNGYGQLGLFNAADQWRTVLMFLPSAFLQVALPVMSKALGPDAKSDDYRRSIVVTQGLSIVVVLPVGAGMMFLADWISRLYGTGFSDGGLVIIGIIAGVMIESVVAAVGPAIQATGRMWLGFGMNMFWGIAFTIFVWCVAPFWGAVAVAFAFVISYLLLATLSFLYLRPMLPEKMGQRAFLTLIYVLLLTVACTVLPPWGRLVLAIPCVIITIWLTYFVFLDDSLRYASVGYTLLMKILRTNTEESADGN